MKKLIVILLILFVLCGCKQQKVKPNLDIDTSTMKAPDEYPDDYFTWLTNDNQDKVYSVLGHLGSDTVWPLGIDVPAMEFDTYGGGHINLGDKKGKVYIMEFMASWCNHCQDATKQVILDLVKSFPNVEYIQIFIDGEDDGIIEEFYKELELDVPTNETLCLFNPELKDFMLRVGLGSIPTFVVVDEYGKIGMVSIGTDELDWMKNMVNYVIENDPIYMLETKDGKTLFEAIHLSEEKEPE